MPSHGVLFKVYICHTLVLALLEESSITWLYVKMNVQIHESTSDLKNEE